MTETWTMADYHKVTEELLKTLGLEGLPVTSIAIYIGMEPPIRIRIDVLPHHELEGLDWEQLLKGAEVDLFVRGVYETP